MSHVRAVKQNTHSPLAEAKTAALNIIRDWVATLQDDTSALAQSVEAEIQSMPSHPVDRHGASLPPFSRDAYYVDGFISDVQSTLDKGRLPRDLSVLRSRIDRVTGDFREYLTHGETPAGEKMQLPILTAAFDAMVNQAKAAAQTIVAASANERGTQR